MSEKKHSVLPESLITDTPDKGFQLAITLSRLGVKMIQPNMDTLFKLRSTYIYNADSLIAASHVIAVHFQTISIANNGWR